MSPALEGIAAAADSSRPLEGSASAAGSSLPLDASAASAAGSSPRRRHASARIHRASWRGGHSSVKQSACKFKLIGAQADGGGIAAKTARPDRVRKLPPRAQDPVELRSDDPCCVAFGREALEGAVFLVSRVDPQ